MKKTPPPTNPEAYVESLTGWRRELVDVLRGAVQSACPLEEVIKWGHLVYFENGPVLLIRAEEERVLLGFWRGQRLAEIEPLLKKGGKYEMATLELREGMTLKPASVRKLTREAVALNQSLGDPTKLPPTKLPAAKGPPKKKAANKKRTVKSAAKKK